jgi:hypothetical protein
MEHLETSIAFNKLRNQINKVLIAYGREPLEEADEPNVVDTYKGVSNGDVVTIRDGRSGVVEHIMTGGILGIAGSPFAIETSEENPGMTIRLIRDGEQTEFLLNIQFTDVVN